MSKFSEEFLVHGVKNADDFLQYFNSLSELYSVNPSQISPSTPIPISTTAMNTGSRKRKSDSETPHRSLPPALRPLKIVTTPKSSNAGVSLADIDDDIQKCFVGK